jgi:SAM-dependent methyltransferase
MQWPATWHRGTAIPSAQIRSGEEGSRSAGSYDATPDPYYRTRADPPTTSAPGCGLTPSRRGSVYISLGPGSQCRLNAACHRLVKFACRSPGNLYPRQAHSLMWDADGRLQPLPDDRLARALERWPNRPALALLRALEAQHYYSLTSEPGACVDLGCGNGKFGEVLGLDHAVGVDLDVSDLQRAEQSEAYGQIVLSDIRCLPFSDAHFGCAVCNSTLEHVDNDVEVLSEASRVLRPGGTFSFTVPTPSKESLLYFGRTDIVGDDDLAAKYRSWFTRRWRHHRYRSISDWEALLEGAGFDVLTINRYEGATAAWLGDALGYVDLRLHELPVVGRHKAPSDVLVRLLYGAIEPYWRGDSEVEVAPGFGGVFIHAVRR